MAKQTKIGSALYFPWTEIPNSTWVKSALLYWDDLHRIVPDEYDREPTALTKLLSERALLKTVSPREHVEGAAHRLLETINAEKLDVFLAAFRARSRQPDPRFPAMPLYRGKMGTWLLQKLRERGLVSETERIVSLPPALGQLYMSCLASQAADSLTIAAVTDSAAREQAAKRLVFGDAARNQAADYHRVLMRVGTAMPVPAELGQTTLDDILAFRERHAHERRQFRDTVERAMVPLREKPPREAADIILHDFKNELDAARRAYAEPMRGRLGRLTNRVLQLTGYAVIGSVAEFTGVPKPLQLALAGAGILYQLRHIAIDEREQTRLARSGNPHHYIGLIRDELVRERWPA